MDHKKKKGAKAVPMPMRPPEVLPAAPKKPKKDAAAAPAPEPVEEPVTKLSKKAKREAGEAEAETRTTKRPREEAEPAPTEDQPEKKKKKDKKHKKAEAEAEEKATEHDKAPADAQPEKKKKDKRKAKAAAAPDDDEEAATEEAFVDEDKELEDEDPATELDVEAAEKLRSKKDKKKKGIKQAKDERAPASPQHPPVHLGAGEEHKWNDWSQATFGGDATKQAKFLRLMGLGKAGAAPAAKADALVPPVEKQFTKATKLFDPSAQSAIDDRVKQKIERDLETQFQKGVQLRKGSHRGQHLGLGFSGDD